MILNVIFLAGGICIGYLLRGELDRRKSRKFVNEERITKQMILSKSHSMVLQICSKNPRILRTKRSSYKNKEVLPCGILYVHALKYA